MNNTVLAPSFSNANSDDTTRMIFLKRREKADLPGEIGSAALSHSVSAWP
jgi:hypothetical protein